jgi:hypothetical protein
MEIKSRLILSPKQIYTDGASKMKNIRKHELEKITDLYASIIFKKNYV